MKPERLYVAFRYDDVSSTSPLAIERNLIEIFANHAITCTFGVIPRIAEGDYRKTGNGPQIPLTQNKLEMLKRGIRLGSIDIALHGFDHRNISSGRKRTEFRGLSHQSQVERIMSGKRELEQLTGASVSTFIPPWNTYDKNTLRALRDIGLSCVSANRDGPVISVPGLQYLPSTTKLSGLEQAVSYARKINDIDAVAVVLFHPYDFHESGDSRATVTCEELNEKLTRLLQQNDINIRSVGQLSNEKSFSAHRYRRNRTPFLEDVMPPFVTRTKQIPLLLSPNHAIRNKSIRLLATLSLYLTIGLLAAFLGRSAAQLGSYYIQMPNTILATVILPFIAVLLRRAYNRKRIYLPGFSALVGLLGIFFGMILF